jgi:hypothetical protein
MICICAHSIVMSANASEAAVWPDFCHSLARPETLTLPQETAIESWRKAQYENKLTFNKYDIVCFGEDVVIDRPLRSGGGDLVIFANSLIITAPIDTRIYRQLDVGSGFLNPTQGAPFPEGSSAFNYYNVLDLIKTGGWENDKKILSAYVEYYGCRDQCIEVDGKKFTHRAPDGLTRPMINMPMAGSFASEVGAMKHDGMPPPDSFVDFKYFKSGDVYIYARSLKVSPDVKLPLIHVSGAPGGVGGAGEPYNCIGGRHQYQSEGFSCLDWTSSTLNAPGGRGGDAGNITISVDQTLDAKKYKKLQSLIDSLVSIDGGLPGPSAKLRSPTYAGNPLSLHLFENEGEWPAGKPGVNGIVRVLRLSDKEFFNRFYQVVNAKDSFPFYNYQELSNRTINDSSKDYLRFDDYITKVLVRKIIGRLESVVADARRLFVNSSDNPITVAFPGEEKLCLGFEDVGSFSEQVSTAMLELNKVCSLGASPFRGFLSANGGLLNVVDKEANKSFLQATLGYNYYEDKELWHKMLSALLVSQSVQMRAFASQERARYDDKLLKLRSQVSNLEQAMKAVEAKNSSTPNYLGMGATVMKAYSSVAGFMDVASNIYTTAQSDSEISAEQLNKLTKSAGDMSKAFSEIGAVSPQSFSSGILGTQQQIFGIKKNIVLLQSAQSEFLQDMSSRSKEALQSASAELSAAIDKRAQYGRKIRSRIIFFGDFLKLSILSYYMDPSLSIGSLAANLNSLKIFLSSFPTYDPNFVLRDFPVYCDINESMNRCITVAPHTKTIILYTTLKTPVRSGIEIPLYVLAPSSVANKFQVSNFAVRSGQK